MTLKEWVESRPVKRGEVTRLQLATGLAYTTVLKIVHGGACKYETAKRISEATGGAVSVAELCEPAAESA